MSSRTRHRIAAFWAWWAIQNGNIAAAIADGSIKRWIPEITDLVHAIDAGLAWELMPGGRATHALVVTAEGKGELIGLAEDWVKGSPSADATWEYHPARPSATLGAMTVGGFTFDLRDVRARWTCDDGREQLDVELWHAAWAHASPNELAVRSQLFLDRLLGEVDKQRWIGHVDASEAARDGTDPASLRAAVHDLAGAATRQKWLTSARRTADGRSLLVTVNEALKRIDHPDATWHVIVAIDGDGREAGDSRAKRTDDVVALLEGHQASLAGIVVDADRSSLHFVVDPTRGAVAAALQWARSVARARAEAHADPAWTFRRELMLGG
jgi:hypothetical protein